KRALMGKRRVKHAVTFDELRLVTCYRELQVQEQSGLVRAVLSGIVNSTKHRMALAQIRRRIGAQVVQACIDAHAKIDLRMAHERHEPLKREAGIGLPVDRDDEFAASAQQLVDGEVLDVATIGDVEPRPLLGHPNAGHLTEQTKKTGPARSK